MKSHLILVAAAVIFALPGLTLHSSARPDDRTGEAAKLHALFDEFFNWQLSEYPEMAMSRGDYSNAHRVSDNSMAAIERRHQKNIEFRARLAQIDRTKLSEDDVVNWELFDLDLSNTIEGFRFRRFLAPISGRGGPQQDIPEMADRVRFANVKDYENYLARLEQIPQRIDNTIEHLRLGVKEGRTQPRVTVAGVPDQFDALLSGNGLKALAKPFENPPATLAPDQLSKLKERFDTKSLPAIRSALTKLSDFFNTEYLPNCRDTIAAADWPDGENYYNFQLRVMTTTDLTAKQIHEIGLAEVKRIKAEMMQVIRSSDFMQMNQDAAKLPDQLLFNLFVQYLRSDPRFYYSTGEELLAGYRDICKRVDAQMPKFFKTLPRLPYGVEEIPLFMAPQQTTAYYQSGDIRNQQAGYFMANTYQLDQRPKYEMITLAIHEAVPGHHHQVALAQEMENQPEFRKDAWFTAYGEGWALYSERLAIEMGLITNPYDDFGRLTYEMWRACRLVVDPGMHALGWTRDQAIEFMTDNTALSELNIRNEVDRYIAWPGQATAYKIGEIKIRELRERAEKSLGEKFDIREFHDVVLNAGAIPLGVLERRVNEWIAEQKGR